jgi:nicotinate phosphoribosyltransferase
MAHSFILAHADETTAFEHFATSQPRNIVLLIDTYDTERAAHKVVELAARLKARGIAVRGVRIDSGDLAAHAHAVRAILDAGGCRDLTIFASGSLDEYTLAKLKANGAPIDGFGIGTALDTSADQPYLDCAYKLEEYAGIARRKRSEHKETWPGAKQVYRELDPKGRYSFDILTVAEDREPGMPLLHPVMMGGKRLSPPEPLSAIRARAKESLASLPNELCAIDGPFSPYPVRISDELRSLTHSVDVIRCRT